MSRLHVQTMENKCECCAIGLSAASAATLQLKVPGNVTTYVVFTGSLTVAYAIDRRLNVTSASIDLVELNPTDDSVVLSVVTSFDLPTHGLMSGEFSLGCGTIDHAGRYRLRLDFRTEDAGAGSRRTRPVEAVWPSLVVSLPTTHVVLDSGVSVSVAMRRQLPTVAPLCPSLHPDPGHFIIELVFSGRAETKNGQLVVEPRKVI